MQPLYAHSWAEAYLYLKVTFCPSCSQGPWEVAAEPPAQAGHCLLARCTRCGRKVEFAFCDEQAVPEGAADSNGLPQPPAASTATPEATTWEASAGQAEREDEVINPTDRPSRILDVGQWLSLLHHLLENATQAIASDKKQTRRHAYQAAMCLEEALKFYTEQSDLPPPSAFFVQPSREAFERVPERFTRQRLLDMRSKLPDIHHMQRRLAKDAAAEKTPKSKWKFWRKG
jgi:hypothetical protein